ncbi:MAG: hypothetical protein AAF645_22545, partial [Myxococcota bacterium]
DFERLEPRLALADAAVVLSLSARSFAGDGIEVPFPLGNNGFDQFSLGLDSATLALVWFHRINDDDENGFNTGAVQLENVAVDGNRVFIAATNSGIVQFGGNVIGPGSVVFELDASGEGDRRESDHFLVAVLVSLQTMCVNSRWVFIGGAALRDATTRPAIWRMPRAGMISQVLPFSSEGSVHSITCSGAGFRALIEVMSSVTFTIGDDEVTHEVTERGDADLLVARLMDDGSVSSFDVVANSNVRDIPGGMARANDGADVVGVNIGASALFTWSASIVRSVPRHHMPL